jgi:hypothetical protein
MNDANAFSSVDSFNYDYGVDTYAQGSEAGYTKGLGAGYVIGYNNGWNNLLIKVVIVGSILYLGKKSFFPSTLKRIGYSDSQRIIQSLDMIKAEVQGVVGAMYVTGTCKTLVECLQKSVVKGKGLEFNSQAYLLVTEIMDIASLSKFMVEAPSKFQKEDRDRLVERIDALKRQLRKHVDRE